MPNIATVLKEEIARVARKEIRTELALLKRQSAQYRRDIAAFKRENAELKRRLDFIERQEKKRLGKPVTPDKKKQLRFSPAWLKKHRAKLGLSAANYAKLIGVSLLSIYNWEQGKTQPRQQQVAALAAIRGLGKREAEQRLEMLDG